MSLKYSSTTADYLQWSEAMNLIRKLARDSNYKMSLLIALGCFTGLRISDILALISCAVQSGRVIDNVIVNVFPIGMRCNDKSV